ncbi:trypsin-like peptidase domain-containing protein, partial [Candidatus Saccharibacteria bacterium]|nr:trypsin-like peptidase domain-containing protein [Candidatus Saccharibacteria bacterium]
QPPTDVLKRVNVQSELGFKLNYDNRVYSSYAEVGDSTAGSDTSAAVASGETYENNDLRVLRAYNYVRIRPIESIESARALAPLPPELELYATVSQEDLTKAAAVPENKGMSKIGLFVKLDSDKRLAKKVADDKTVVTINASKPVSQNIGGVDYQKVRFTTTNDNYRVSNVKYDDCYYTIQYDQPYSICISDVRPFNVSVASLVEQVFDSITFEQPVQKAALPDAKNMTDASKKTSFSYPLARLAQATTNEDKTTAENLETTTDTAGPEESPLLTITPSYYNDADSLKSIAKTQPSVVRIGMLYCADLTLKFESGETATNLTDACVGSMSSGVFVSKDGYIATTGHAIRTQKKAVINGYINFAPDQDAMLDRLQRILDYLLKAKIILQSDADYLKTGASIGDQEALAKVENIASVIPDKFITPINEEYTYAIQPTEKPIVVNRSDTNKPSFAYSDSVIKAKYVASNYDATKSIQEVFDSATPNVDVGLLKAEGDFPDVVVASAEDVKSNDTLNTIGYPAYTDSSLIIDKIRNIPIVTTSKVEQAYEKDGTRLIQTDMPVLPGNDGAPVVNGSGQL